MPSSATSAPVRPARRRWGIHLAFVAAVGVAAGALAVLDLAGGGRGAFIDMSGVVAAGAALSWLAYAALSTALFVWFGASPDRLVPLHLGALVAAPVLVFGAWAAWMAMHG